LPYKTNIMKRIALLLSLLLVCTNFYAQQVIGEYQSKAFDKAFKIGTDAKYAEYKGKDIKAKKYPCRVYMEVYSLDYDKRAFLEFNKNSAREFVRILKEEVRKYAAWQQEGAKSRFENNNFCINPERFSVNVYFAKHDSILDDKMFGKADNQEYYIEFYYNRNREQARMFLRSGKINDSRLGADFQLTGWSVIFLEPNLEVQQIIELLEKAIKMI